MPNPGVKMSFAGKTLSPTNNASLNGKPFRLNPFTLALPFTVKSSQTPTIGGMVVQVFGVEMGDLVVTGNFGKGGWVEQVAFLERMKNLAISQASPVGVKDTAPPVRFLYPQRSYDFMVHLKEYSSASGMAVDFQNENFNPDWKLTFFIDNDNTNGMLKKVATNAYIARLAAGFGYVPNKYMGQISAAQVENFLASQGYANNLYGYIQAAFGAPGTTTPTTPTQGGASGGNSGGSAPTPSAGKTTSMTATTKAYVLQLNGGDTTQANAMEQVITYESGGNSTIYNPTSLAFGIAQALGHGTQATQGTLANQYGGFGLSTKQAIAANSGDAEAQLLWMYNYIQSRYGSCTAALSFHLKNGYY